MVLDVFGGMGVGSNARKRWKCQAGQCLIRVGRNWNEIGNGWKEIGNKLERNWRTCEDLREFEGTAVMRGRAGNAMLMGQMVYAIWFSF